MAHISYPFKKTNKSIYRKPSSVVTSDSLYWKKFGSPFLIKEFGAIDYLDFSPVEPYYFAATCSVRVQVYDPIAKVVTKNISSFVEGAYGGTFRNDGRLLVAGSEEKAVKLFDVHSKNALRIFSDHTAPVHRTLFSKDQLKVLSFSDDKSVNVWDIATETKLSGFTEHTDYVRAGAASPISPDIILSGSYDNSVKLYDCRSNELVLSVHHGSPVESAVFLPSGGIFISAGGTEIKVWDLFNGGKLLSNISQHHKTVTCLRLASNGSRLLSASLDRHVKIHDVSTFKVVHNIDFPNAILSMAISEQDDTLAVGMIDGVISIRKREELVQKSNEKKGHFKFAPDNIIMPVAKSKTNKKKFKRQLEPKADALLRKTKYEKSLSIVLKPYTVAKNPEYTVALIQEMLRRKVLHNAIIGLADKQIGDLLKFLIRNLGVTNFTRTVIDAANVFTDVFENQVNSFSELNLKLYKRLIRGIKEEIELCERISELEGAIGLLLAGAQYSTDQNSVGVNEIALTPSASALQEIVIDV